MVAERFEKTRFGPSGYSEGREGTENWRGLIGTDGSDECRKEARPQAYLGIRDDLEFGRGVRTPPPDLRFRNLLKSAT